ncbi:glycosyltransferase [Deinococcus koreensis]|uniref:glycosyltransferase n=1 Tax=Deinococcus koreensis TaxID=2054903 RepID=UPI000DD503CC|nr:glycosyltransferase [Deinococcus koreensis]
MAQILLDESNLGAVVVCFDTGSGFTNRLRRLLNVSHNIVVVINRFSDVSNQSSFVRQIKSDFIFEITVLKLIIIELDDNYGIGHALNRGVQYLPNRVEWIIFFDDDTELMFESSLSIYHEVRKTIEIYGDEKFGILGLGYRDSLEDSDKTAEDSFKLKYSVITSGSVIKKSTLQLIGAFREDYFIDSVDIEYCIRLKSKGLYVAQSGKIAMIHPIGEKYTRNVLGRKIVFTKHNSLRCYYITRNRILLGKQYFRLYPELILSSTLQTIKHSIEIVLYEDQKMLKLKSMCIGCWHGICGISGKLVKSIVRE